MNCQELRLIETAIETILGGEYFASTKQEIESFINNWRILIAGKIRIVNTDGDIPIIVQFPTALSLPTTVAKARAAKAATEDADEDEAVD